MAQGDGAAVNVDLLAVPFEQLADGQRLDGKGLVGFDQIHLVQRPAGALQRLAAGAHRADAHHRRVDPGDRRADNARQHRQPKLVRFIDAHQQDRRSAVVQR